MLYYTNSPRAVLKHLESSQSKGLSENQAKIRLKNYGPNEIKVKGTPFWKKLIAPFTDVFTLVLFGAAAVSLVQQQWIEALVIFIIVGVSAVIYFAQTFSAERILKSLAQKNSQQVTVLRTDSNGASSLYKLAAGELVPGDIIQLNEGEKVPADARILLATSTKIDESMLTGESEPIDKTAETLSSKQEVYAQSNMLFQGSFVVSGEVTAVVTNTGNTTEFGKLALLSKPSADRSPVQKKIDRLVKQIIGAVGVIAVVTFLLSISNGVSLGESIRFVIVLAVSAVPESLPVAISVILVLGMKRMAKKKALVRNMRAIETVGAITTIATDKTGTLTRNKLTVQETWQPVGSSESMVAIAAHAQFGQGGKNFDPLDVAIREYTEREGHAQSSMPVTALPFDQSVVMSGNIWHHGDTYRLVVKGAPEKILSHTKNLTEDERETAEQSLHKLTSQGYRVIALAHANLVEPVSTFKDLPEKTAFDFVGFLAVADVLRPEAAQAIAAAQAAGVSVRMITGDHAETAYHIAKQLGMVNARSQVFDSQKALSLTDDELRERVAESRVFARVTPESKYKILEILKKDHITAMTGDGVNDVPALSSAHVGVAMGSGSQIAKEAGDIVLLDDNFKTIIDAMHEGRIIIANIRRMLFYLLSTNAGEILTMIGALALGKPAPLAPIQILWTNLVTDTSMSIPLGLEPGERDEMQRPPRKVNAPILSRHLIIRMMFIALSMAAMTLTVYLYFLDTKGEEYAQTLAFATLITTQWANAFSARSNLESVFTRIRTVNIWFYVGFSIALILQALAFFGPLGDILHIARVETSLLFTIVAIAFVTQIAICELHKLYGRSKNITP
ncbi:cation-transporting P-type ATPase [Candidatus Saccharibacteria bacterium]|nr:cation-transporting P-type ATPase [Candidatus Saccharibacteria bacterium]